MIKIQEHLGNRFDFTGQRQRERQREDEKGMPKFEVELKRVVDDSYEIEIGHGLVDQVAADLKHGLAGKVHKFAIITDSNVEPLYARPLEQKLAEEGFQTDVFIFPAGEKSKTRQTKAMLEDAMLEKGYRSLLAAADASVGGKTAVDTPLATNLIGLINQPQKVYLDLDTWKTLPEREIYSGLAETIKHACLADAEFFEYLEAHMEEILALDQTACEHIAEKNCSIKYHVVMKDERETGLREVLNLGHTVGRAVETVSEYRLLHGEAVAIGLAAEVRLSQKMGYMTDAQAERVIALLKRAKLPTEIPLYIDREKLVKKLYTDKKVRDGKLRFVVQNGIGEIVCFGENVYATPVSEETAREIIMQL